jgi:hypothetical protein
MVNSCPENLRPASLGSLTTAASPRSQRQHPRVRHKCDTSRGRPHHLAAPSSGRHGLTSQSGPGSSNETLRNVESATVLCRYSPKPKQNCRLETPVHQLKLERPSSAAENHLTRSLARYAYTVLHCHSSPSVRKLRGNPSWVGLAWERVPAFLRPESQCKRMQEDERE